MTAFFFFLALIAALAVPWNLLVAGGRPAALGLLVGFAAFGADPTEPLRALLFGGAAFGGLALLRCA